MTKDYEWKLTIEGEKYNPKQLRVPAGSSQGGQWTSEGGGGGGASAPATETPKTRAMRKAAESVFIANLEKPEDLGRLKNVRYRKYKRRVDLYDINYEFGHMRGSINESDTRRGKFTFDEFVTWLELHGAKPGKKR